MLRCDPFGDVDALARGARSLTIPIAEKPSPAASRSNTQAPTTTATPRIDGPRQTDHQEVPIEEATEPVIWPEPSPLQDWWTTVMTTTR